MLCQSLISTKLLFFKKKKGYSFICVVLVLSAFPWGHLHISVPLRFKFSLICILFLQLCKQLALFFLSVIYFFGTKLEKRVCLWPWLKKQYSHFPVRLFKIKFFNNIVYALLYKKKSYQGTLTNKKVRLKKSLNSLVTLKGYVCMVKFVFTACIVFKAYLWCFTSADCFQALDFIKFLLLKIVLVNQKPIKKILLAFCAGNQSNDHFRFVLQIICPPYSTLYIN